MQKINHRICLAPMIDWTDKHFRYFIRLLTKNAVLYTEMITTGAVLHGDQEYLLAYNPEEHPVALQLGGSDPDALAKSAKIAKAYGYDEINLNVGCPSKRVQSGSFGACLMKEPELVADCVAAMIEAVSSDNSSSGPIPVTVKSRIGVDEQEGYENLLDFVDRIKLSGCKTFIVHARKAWLEGLSPKQNREIPPLKYEYVYQLKKDFPELEIIINGGVNTHQAVVEHLEQVDGVMIGREAYKNPGFFMTLEQQLFSVGSSSVASKHQVILDYLPYIEQQLELGVKLSALVRPILCLFNGEPGAKQWRRYLSTYSHRPGVGKDIVSHALELVGSS